jgi:hypothetical protein
MKNVHEIEIKLTTEWEKCLDDAFKKNMSMEGLKIAVGSKLNIGY